MKYKNLEQIAQEADVHPAVGMSRRERLERWANLLAQQPERRLCAIEGTEFGTRPERLAKRADDSPITVAFQDPVLRAAGLRGDRVVRDQAAQSRPSATAPPAKIAHPRV